ncbi:YpdA family putative bacillithiol disulfide reductase [Arachidicoccus terrestris]|uniref:YpdA family putative bacillithiol disulfide reductase n=1 Tax=Arachidicoccus terrestris TaxID=2875539 RepID=UPI001CC4FAF8|nr:YpdA family putative bacillithiol disulfide reductase [Arachidicoccus terrestris]UAY54962.1 YpdA family putative bacillithiol disulfide reductase [Arachidicoccus terrestris]
METLDILIVGAGPIGLTCGIEAKKAGLNYLIIEKGALVNSLFNYPIFMTFFSTADRLEIGGLPFMCLAPKPGRQEALEYYRQVTHYFGLHVHLYEEVKQIQKEADGSQSLFLVETSKGDYQARKVIIATGFYDVPIYMDIPGENLPKVHHYYKEAHPYVMEKTLVVGANNSAVDAALEIWRKGGDVTMLIRGNEIGKRVKYWVKPDIENRIAEGSIKAYFESELLEIGEKEVVLKDREGQVVTIPNDYVLAMTGFRPDFDMLRRFGIKIDEPNACLPDHDPETMETNIEGLYLAGVVCGGLNTHKWFIENSRVHAEKIVRRVAALLKASK